MNNKNNNNINNCNKDGLFGTNQHSNKLTLHSHSFPEFLLQSALSVLQLQLSGTLGQKQRSETSTDQL